jgi:hypothetical protein
MLMTNLHYAKVLFNSHLLAKAWLHDDVDAKETLDRVLWKIILNLVTYFQALKNFVNFVES